MFHLFIIFNALFIYVNTEMTSITLGGFLFGLVDEWNKEIQLGQNFGLLTARRAGYSEVITDIS